MFPRLSGKFVRYLVVLATLVPIYAAEAAVEPAASSRSTAVKSTLQQDTRKAASPKRSTSSSALKLIRTVAIHRKPQGSKTPKVIVKNVLLDSNRAASRPPETAPAGDLTGNQVSDNLRGWGFVFSLLIKEGVDPEYLRGIFQDPRMPLGETLHFSLRPREPKAMYRHHDSSQAELAALSCYERYQTELHRAEATFKVPASVILAVLQVETSCGRNMGSSLAFPRIARLVGAASPATIEANYKAKSVTDPTVTREAVSARAEWLRDTFLPHLVGALIVGAHRGVHPLDLRGSGSGAIGAPQFLPGHYFSYGVDGDGDNQIDLFGMRDAIFSVARYLKDHGWKAEPMTEAERRGVIWHYNRSEPYIDSVLGLADKIQLRTVAYRKPPTPRDTVLKLIPASLVVR